MEQSRIGTSLPGCSRKHDRHAPSGLIPAEKSKNECPSLQSRSQYEEGGLGFQKSLAPGYMVRRALLIETDIGIVPF